MTHVPPSIKETAFNCPHCGALANQHWHSLMAIPRSYKEPLPQFLDRERCEVLTFDNIKNPREREQTIRKADRLVDGWPVLGDFQSFHGSALMNVFVARCFNCTELSVWIHERLVFPSRGEAPAANVDLPEEIRRDYDEASSILDRSPRGAAALLRLAIQKLCKELGEPGKDLNKDIGSLVSKGLEHDVQMALDIVRVIGNEAVHPGQMYLHDDRSTAETLFRLLNLIAERMISQPNRVKEVYSTLPEGALKAIEKRDSGS